MSKNKCMVVSKEMAAAMDPSHVRFILEGRGVGRGKDYVPFLKTEDVRGDGIRTITPTWSGDEADVMSRIEDAYFLMADWSDLVDEAQTQVPLDINRTMIITKAMGWKHPAWKGRLIVMTSDIRMYMSDGTLKVRAIKNARELANKRVLQKLWIERVYWMQEGVRDWKIFTQHEVNVTRIKNILALREYRALSSFKVGSQTALRIRAYCESHLLEHGCLSDCATACDDALGEDAGTSLAVAKYLIANGDWQWDLSVLFNPREPGLHRKLITNHVSKLKKSA